MYINIDFKHMRVFDTHKQVTWLVHDIILWKTKKMLDDKNHIYLSSTNINVNKNKAQALFVRFVPYIWTTDLKISVTHLKCPSSALLTSKMEKLKFY